MIINKNRVHIKIYVVFIALFFLTLGANAQQKSITGTVTDKNGEPIPGVSIVIKGTSEGTITNFDGNFTLSGEYANDAILVFSFIGMKTQEITINSQSAINVSLEEDVLGLDEVVVIGYGTQRKKDLTTAVSIVGEDDIKGRPMVSAAEALQGKAAGVQVVQPSGEPGAGLSIRVRGATSVLAGNEPLYVVDGVPTTNINGLDPSDIASMSVLKDASSAAIYGARAANGVVIITTKRGQENQSIINFSTYFGISNLRKPVEVLNTEQYSELMNEIKPGTMDPSITNYTDWNKETFGTGKTQSYQLSFSQGTEKSQYYLATSYLSNEGIVRPAKFDRYSVRFNLDNELKPWLKVKTSVNLLNLRTLDTPDNASSGRGGVIMSALNTPPFLNVYNSDGSGQYDPNPFQPSWENPVAYMEGADQQATDQQIFGNIGLEAKIIEGLYYKTRVGLDILNHKWDYYLDPFKTSYGRKNNGIGQSDKFNSQTWLWENTMDYAKTFGNHNITGLIGSSIQKYLKNDSYLSGNDFPADVSVTTLNAANTITGSTDIQEWALASFFARATYDYSGKYYVTASLRRDGSSKLANPWGTMPSFSAGWRISSEPFMENIESINDLKLRGGWGMNGNQEGIPNYAQYGLVTYTRVNPTNPLSGPSSYQSTYGNPDLKWETTSQTNFGIDLSMFNSRLTANFDVYYKITDDVLLNVQLPNTLPISTIQTNAGTIENKGIELNLGTVNTTGELKWSTDFNVSVNRNEVTALEYTDVYYFGRIYSNNQDVTRVKVGLPLGSFYGYISEGVDSETGDMKFKDVNGNGFLDTEDRTVIGDPQADFIWGFNNTLSYKQFELIVFFQGSYGNDVYNATRIDLEGMFDSKNQSVDVLNRWRNPGDNTNMPRAVGGGNVDNVRNSSRFIEDGTYARLKSLTLSYNVLKNSEKIKAIKNMSIYFTGQNLLTFTKYTGFDPEVNAYGNSATVQGVDYGTYPQARTFIVGLNVEF